MGDKMGPQRTIDALASVPYFQTLSPSGLNALKQQAVRRSYAAEEVIFFEGDMQNALYIVESGYLKAIKMAPSGREQVLHVLGPGEVFNAFGVFTDTPAPASIVALEDVTLLNLHKDIILTLLEEHPAIAREVIESMAQRILRLVRLVEDLSLRSVESRLARLLLDRAEDGVLERRRWSTQAEMAAHLGTVPDVLNRALRNMVAAGLIELERHQIRILDPEAVRARAEAQT